MFKKIILMGLAFFLGTAGVLAQPQNPPDVTAAWLNFQGKLVEGGSAVSGTRTMTFRLYDSATGGELWWENTKNVAPYGIKAPYSDIPFRIAPIPCSRMPK